MTKHWVLVGRAALLGLTSYALAVAADLVIKEHPVAADAQRTQLALDGNSPRHFVCPMHSQVQSLAPGDCPICRMSLQEVEPAPGRPVESPSAPARDRALRSVTVSAEIAQRLRYDIILPRRHVLSGVLRAAARVERNDCIAALFSKDEAKNLKEGEPSSLVVANGSGQAVSVRYSGQPAEPWDGSTSLVRFVADGPPSGLRPGVNGWLRSPAREREVLIVPEEALVHTSAGPNVISVSPDHRTYTLRSVEIGQTIEGLVAIVSGLQDGELILGRDVFFMDAESRNRAERGLGASRESQ